jgi:NADH-quinone oxidoreductase subunit F
MSIFRAHILLPVDEGTVQAGIFQIKRQIESELANYALTDEVKVLETGTVGLVGKGVTLVIYPDNIHYYNVKEEDVKTIVEQHIVKGRIVESLEHVVAGTEVGLKSYHTLGLTRKQERIVLDKGWKIDPENIDEVLAAGGYKAIEKILTDEITPEEVIASLKTSGLRGRGGAGFPTGLKWEFTRNADGGQQKYVICNADEGEPGTFKDRLILEGDPHKLVEAMMIAGYAIGATKGFIYIRGEYKLSIDRTQKAIDEARKYNLLGNDILETGFIFDLEIKKGAGAYVCGEETALIESMEGKRGNPRTKPPYPVTNGLWDRPTCVNNVETLANVPSIIMNGSEWFKKFGTAQSAGTKVFTILGHVEQPGLIEVEMGTPLREILYLYGGGIKDGKKFKAALVGGSAGVFLSDKLLDVKMDFEDLRENKAALGSGAILVMNETTCIVDMLFSVLKFFAHESCGQCAPCRIGTRQLLDLVYKIRAGKGEEKDIDQMVKTANTMYNTSLCPLGQSLIMPVKSAIKNFREDFVNKIQTTN